MPLIKLFLDICLFARGPQDVPASKFLLGLTALAYLVVGIALQELEPEIDWLSALFETAVEAVLPVGFVWIVLSLAQKMPRFLQTAIAMYGCDALISTFALPMLAWLLVTPDAVAVYILLFLLILWHLAVVAHILRQALAIPVLAAVGAALIYMVASYNIMLALFPRAA